MLVIAPLRPCYLVWPKEQQKWSDFSALKVVVLHGTDKDELVKQNADIYVVNPDGIPWLLETGFFTRAKPDTLCVDESSQYKRTDTRRFSDLKKKLDTFARRWTLTGTPSSNGYLDVFGQAYVTDMGAALGSYITAYRNTYFDAAGLYGWDLRQGSEQLIQRRLKPIVCRIDMSDFVHIPTEVPNYIYVDLPPKIRVLYDQMEAVMFAKLENSRTVTALSAAAAMTKCSQIACGGVYIDPEMDETTGLLRTIGEARETVQLHNAKTDALELLHEELGYKPLLVAYWWKHDLDRLRKRFGKDIPILGGSGSTTAAMKRDLMLEAQWNRGELPMLFGNPASVAHGLNLQGAGNDVAWHSMIYDLELFIQFNKRVMRQGNAHQVCRVHRIITRGTVDEAMDSALLRKDASQRSLLNALREYGEHRGHEVGNLNQLTRKTRSTK
jgi:SNF2 family DNA or RNA helicase